MASKHWITATDPDVPSYNKDAVNAQLKSDDGTFFISYIGDMKAANAKFGLDKKVPPSNKETALVQYGTGPLGLNSYFELDGDHREAYEKLIDKGFEACYKYYEEHKNADN
jgi:hypothetical protein